ncbi:peroxisomal biogenesis factor 3-like protein [Leptotrombidium deliense]|uniref:Peroxisomal biogenesis factor 3 n=1 Tax=Leptotrombidium deliense TaxID=299467 RepID=A0A443SIM2_9ACAR|nr:peroxisomal biogenesis factor 3-like protein [Leptotrombidium deliense]
MSFLSSTWQFVKRHKGKIFVIGGAVGGYLMLNRYLSEIERKWEKSASKDFVSEVRKKETHFESTLQTCNSTVRSLTPKIIEILDELLDSEAMLKRIESETDIKKKISMWEELRVNILCRLISEVYCLCLFVCYLRTQLTVISGYMYVDSCRNGSNSLINQSIQMKYMSLLTMFYQQGIKAIVAPVEEAVRVAVNDISLKEKINISKINSLFEKIKAIMSFSFSSPDSHFSRYLMDPEKIAHIMNDPNIDKDECSSSSTTLTAKESAIIKKMLAETQDILESNDFKKVLESSIDVGFSVVMDMIVGCFSSIGAQNGFTNPHSTEVAFAKLLPLLNKTLINRKKPDDFLTLVNHLVCLDVLNCFAANIYEAFCEPNQ